MKHILALTDTTDNRGNLTNGMKIARTMLGLGYHVIPNDHDVKEKELKRFDLILAFGTLLYPDRVHNIKRIAEAKDKETVFAFWYFDACNPYFPHCAGKYRRLAAIAEHLDWLITTDHSFSWEEHVKNYLWLMQGINPHEFRRSPSKSENRQYDVIFTGGKEKWFEERKPILEQIEKRFSFVMYGRNSPSRVYGDAFFEAYQKARVAYIPFPPSAIPGWYWSNRIYMATATGTPCVVGYAKGLEEHFRDGKEVIFFRNGDEACRAIDYLLKNPRKRLEMGIAGRKRTLRNHTYEQRIKILMETIFP